MKITYKDLYISSLALYVVCVPFGTINMGSFGSLLKMLALPPLLFCIPKCRSVMRNHLVGINFIFCMWILLSSVWSINTASTISRSITQFELLAVVASSCFYGNELTGHDKIIIKKSLLWSSRLTVILLFTTGALYEGRLTFSGILNEDPNYLCMYFSFGFVCAGEYLLKKNMAKKRRFISVIEMGIYTYAVLLTGSRGGLLALLACFISVVIFQIDSQTNRLTELIKRSLFVLLCAVLFFLLLSTLSEQILSRYSIANVLANGGTGRTRIWKNGLDMFENSWIIRQLIGYGSATVMRAFTIKGYTQPSVMHNIYLEVLVELGMAGAILYIIMIVAFLICSFKFEDKFSFCIMLGFIVMSMSTSLYAFKPYVNILMFIVLQDNIVNNRKQIKIDRG